MADPLHSRLMKLLPAWWRRALGWRRGETERISALERVKLGSSYEPQAPSCNAIAEERLAVQVSSSDP